ncbi:MAG TPA: hypothetical protein VNQ90_17720 [Chthoniobacteraceae bacterium]|nr:hypothetical protein [Chthoniobacteraceae bacterium]
MPESLLDAGAAAAAGTTDQNAGAGAAGAAATPPAGLLNADGTFSDGWLDRLPESLAEARPSLEKFRSFEDLAKSYTSLQTVMGKKADAVFLPNEKSTPEEVAAFRKAAGVPEAPDGYQLKPEQLPEGLTWDDELGKGFAEIAHKHNIPAVAMKELAARYVASEEAKLGAYAQSAEAELATGKQALQKEFGASFQANIQLATRMAGTVGLDPASPGLRDPNVVRALVNMAKMVSEDKIAAISGGQVAGGMTSKSIQTDPSNPHHARYLKGDPEAVTLVRDLMQRGL